MTALISSDVSSRKSPTPCPTTAPIAMSFNASIYLHPFFLLSTRAHYSIIIFPLLLVNLHLRSFYPPLPVSYLFRIYVSHVLPMMFNCSV